jgi:hypothetical protein
MDPIDLPKDSKEPFLPEYITEGMICLAFKILKTEDFSLLDFLPVQFSTKVRPNTSN